MKMSDLFPSKYLKAEDVRGEMVVTIDHVALETFTNRQDLHDEEKACLYFAELEKGLVLNKTNFAKIVELTGQQDTNNWHGHHVTLIVAEVDSFGEVVPAIRIKKALPVNAVQMHMPDPNALIEDAEERSA